MSPVVGTVLLVAIALVLTAAVFAMVNLATDQGTTQRPPEAAFRQNGAGPGATIEVVTAPHDVSWDQISMGPATTAVCTLPTGMMNGGDKIVCASEGQLVLVYSGDEGSVVLYDALIR